jgi:hypothetical protein
LIKVCKECASTWAGGTHCEDCGGVLSDPYAKDAGATLPRSIWGYIRLQYGARRGMLVRVMAYLLGPVVFGLCAREAVLLSTPWNIVGLSGAVLAGFLTWFTIYWLAGRAVRIWVLRKGQLSKRKMARAIWKRIS